MSDIELPLQTPVVDRSSLNLTVPWIDWWLAFLGRVVTAGHPVTKAANTGAFPPTPLMTPGRGLGFLWVTYNLRVTGAAGGSGSVQFQLAWTDDLGPRTFQGTNLMGNKVGDVDTRSVLMYANKAAPITGAVSYTSSGAPPLQYSIALAIENG